MNNRLRLFLLVMTVLALAAFAGSSVLAQEDSTCFNLSAEDCAIITSATENSNTISSFGMDYTLSVDVSVPEMLSFMLELPPTVELDVAGSGTLSLAGSTLGLAMDNSATFDGATEVLNFVLTQDAFYTDFMGEWVGIPLESLVEAAAMSGATDMLPIPLDPSMLAGIEAENLGDLLGSSEDMAATTGADAMLVPYVNYTRGADVDIMGQATYPFDLTLDLGGLLQSPEVSQTIAMMLGMFAPDAEADPMGAAMVEALPMVMETIESQIQVVQYVGSSDNFIHQLDLNMDFSLDLQPLLGPAVEGQEPMDPIVLNVAFSVMLSDINGGQTVAAPDGARMMTPEELDAMMGSDGM